MSAVLEVEHLGKRFGALTVTNDVSLQLGVGDRHALIGPNGAGKSTLVGLLSGTLAADSGRIVLLGNDVTRATPQHRVRAGLVRTFQVNSLFHGLSVLDNVLLALGERYRASRQMFRPVAARADLIEYAHAMLASLGIDRHADQRIDRLPYGPQRLVEVAIALSLEPSVLLLDEPAAGLTLADALQVLDALDRLPAHIAVLMIEHDMHIVRRFAQTVTVLVAGAVLTSGRSAEVMADPEVHRVYLGRAGRLRYGIDV